MRAILVSLRDLLVDEDGPTAVEYAIMLMMVVISCFATIQFLGGQTSKAFSNSGEWVGTVK